MEINEFCFVTFVIMEHQATVNVTAANRLDRDNVDRFFNHVEHARSVSLLFREKERKKERKKEKYIYAISIYFFLNGN